MLIVTIPAIELFDEQKNEFISTKAQELRLEHSLVSISKWESKWCKSFFLKENKTLEETVDYIKCMTLTQNVSSTVYNRITKSILDQISEYISAPMTATSINSPNKSVNKEIITSELIYYQMIALNIPFECQKWHFNRLITLINVCSIKSNPPKKMSNKNIRERNSALNAARRKALNTKG